MGLNPLLRADGIRQIKLLQADDVGIECLQRGCDGIGGLHSFAVSVGEEPDIVGDYTDCANLAFTAPNLIVASA